MSSPLIRTWALAPPMRQFLSGLYARLADTCVCQLAPGTLALRHCFSEMHRYHPSRRARLRAHSLLLSHQGFSIPHIARIYHVDRRSVSSWIDRWQTRGLVGLYDQPGAGRRPTLSADEQHKVQQYLQQYPKDLKKVVHQLEQETSRRVSTKTIKRLIKKNRYVWKRIRKSPAHAPDPHKYARSKEVIHRLQQREAAEECALWYFDVAGFCLTPVHIYCGSAHRPVDEFYTEHGHHPSPEHCTAARRRCSMSCHTRWDFRFASRTACPRKI